MNQIATFFTHLGALNFYRMIVNLDENACMMPVPRAVSASCGTCVRFFVEFDRVNMSEEDMEAVFVETDGRYQAIYRAEET